MDLGTFQWIFGIALSLIGALVAYLTGTVRKFSTMQEKLSNIEAWKKEQEESNLKTRLTVLESSNASSNSIFQANFKTLGEQIQNHSVMVMAQFGLLKDELHKINLKLVHMKSEIDSNLRRVTQLENKSK